MISHHGLLLLEEVVLQHSYFADLSWYSCVWWPGESPDATCWILSFSQQPSSPAGSSEDEGKPPSLDGSSNDPPDDVFLMVTQQHWENKILWEVPYNPGPPITASGMNTCSAVKLEILKYCMKHDSIMRFKIPAPITSFPGPIQLSIACL